MSRSGYTDDYDDGMLAMYRGQVASAIRGKRGQAFLCDLLGALDAMPEKELIHGDLETAEGDVCAIGALGRERKIDMSKLDPEEPEQVAAAFNIAEQLAREVVYENDEGYWDTETPAERWKRMRKWVSGKIRVSERPIEPAVEKHPTESPTNE